MRRWPKNSAYAHFTRALQHGHRFLALRPFVVLAFVACALVAVAAARGIYVPPIPDSEDPAWLDGGTIRFSSNVDYQTGAFGGGIYVMAADGSGARKATDAEADQAPAPPPTGERLEFGSPPSSQEAEAALFLVAQGHRRLLEASVYKRAGAALSPDGRTAVFAEWVGEHNADAITLYSVPTDRSSEPRRLTPTSCTHGIFVGGGPFYGTCLDGTDGPDRLVGTRGGDLVIGGSGDDTIHAGDGMNWIESQWGNDDIRSGPGVDSVWAGVGNDAIRTGAARDTIFAGPGHDIVFAGTGPDVVIANDGERDVIYCGPGDDRARTDRIDVTHSCEHVYVALPKPDPHTVG